MHSVTHRPFPAFLPLICRRVRRCCVTLRRANAECRSPKFTGSMHLQKRSQCEVEREHSAAPVRVTGQWAKAT